MIAEMSAMMDGVDDNRWQAVLSRDAGQDGRFVYAVRSTGVYCRPSCPSRRPGKKQVTFYAGPQEAEGAGFRACKRCRPDGAAGESAQVELVQQACSYIEEKLEEPLTLSRLSEALHVSPFHLHRTFKRALGITPRQYIEARRVEKVKSQLRGGESVTGAIYDAGYGSSSRLYESAPYRMGMTPSAYKKGGLGMRISYTVVESPLGKLLVAATGRGICAVSLGDAEAELEEALHEEYPAAEIERNGEGDRLHEWVKAIVGYIEGAQPDLDLPLDLQATAFQLQVWEALKAIPYGATCSYSQVAAAVGSPSAARAVARACATNPAALVIPCHRVVREDGGLGGYRWGIERKQRLLANERGGE